MTVKKGQKIEAKTFDQVLEENNIHKLQIPTRDGQLLEMYAGMAMQGMLANPDNDTSNFDDTAKNAIGHAKALIEELKNA
jgi:hypothetical protein